MSVDRWTDKVNVIYILYIIIYVYLFTAAPAKHSHCSWPWTCAISSWPLVPAKVCLVKAMVFPVVTYGCESWTIKKAERQRIDTFELWCWRRLLRVPWTARRSNQSILKETSPKHSLEGLMLKLKPLATWWEELIMWKDLDAGKDWRREEKGTTEHELDGWHRWLNGHELE